MCINYAELALAELSPSSLNAELPLLETALRHTLQVNEHEPQPEPEP